MKNPKAFVSHASDDKDRFVAEFALRLRDNGVDAWYDEWEIQAGDSLVQKIFVQGIAEADVFIIVLSETSVLKPWVIEELDSAVVRRISDDCRIIPVIIDECDVPQSLKHLRWERIDDLDSWDDDFQRILNVIFGSSEKPPLGKMPPIANRKAVSYFPSLSKADNMVFEALGERFYDSGEVGIEVEKEFTVFEQLGLTREEILESLEILGADHKLKTHTGFNPNSGNHEVALAQIRWGALEQFSKRKFPDYDLKLRDLISAIANSGAKDRDDIVAKVSAPERLLEVMVHQLDNKGLVHVAYDEMHQFRHVRPKSPKLKRMLG